MNLADIVGRNTRPAPWSEVSKIPWDDPGFSARMLREHLTQDHHAASRRTAVIDEQVGWIHEEILAARPSNVLDLGCGPGLYCHRLASLGHACTGIDFGPASIEYARQTAADHNLAGTFILGDLREVEFGSNRDLIMLIFGEFNTFSRSDALSILRRCRKSLAAGGKLIIEAHTFAAIREMGESGNTWTALEKGLFSDQPYIRLDDACWHEDSRTSVQRHYVIDALTGAVELYGTTAQGYEDEEYDQLLREAGFRSISDRADWPNVHQNELKLLLAAI